MRSLPGSVVLAVALLSIMATSASAQYTLYYGNFHSHCNLSDDAAGGLSGSPGTAFQYARDVANIDVLAITDHSHYMSALEYNQLQSAANAWTTNGTFIALAAQEHGSLSTTTSGAFGHINIWEAATVLDQGLYRHDLAATYSYLAANVDDTIGAPLVASFNHAYSGSGAGIWDQFKSFEYSATGDVGIEFIEVINGKRTASYESEYFEALGKGWKIGALGNQDNHEGGWGDQPNNVGRIPLTGIWAAALTKSDVLQALGARRTFAMEVNPASDRIQLQFKSGGNWMGSEYSTAADSVYFEVIASSPTNIASAQLFRNGTFVKSIGAAGTSLNWNTFDTPGPGDFWYVLKLNQADGDHAWSSPIWVESTSDFSLPLATVNEDDGSGFPTMWFQSVTVQGLVTVGTDIFSPVDNVIYIQDPTAGILIQQFGLQNPNLIPGDNILVTGMVDSFQGQTFISSPSSVQILSQGGAAPSPILITTNELETAGETWENMLVEIRDVAVTGGTWPSAGFDGSVTIDDGTGPATLLIDKDTSVDDAGQPVEPTFWLRGVVVQRAQSPPYTCCWAVLPPSAAELFQPVGLGVQELPSHHATVRTELHPAEPNPVVTRARVRFDLAGTRAQHVKVDVYDVHGRRVRTLVDQSLTPGEYESTWDGREIGGHRVASGVYFVRMVTGDADLSRKIVVLE